MQQKLMAALAAVIEMANSHIEDIESALEIGMYEAANNTDLGDKQDALAKVKAYLAGLTPSAPAVTEHFSGYVAIDGARVQVDFEAPKGASDAERDSAFVTALAQEATLNYLCIGESPSQAVSPSSTGQHEPPAVQLLQELVTHFGDAIQQDEPIDGGDAVEWLGQFWLRAVKVLGSNGLTITKVPVWYWDALRYNPSGSEPQSEFEMEIDDQRHRNGQVYLTVANNANFDDMLSVTMEVNRLLGSEDDMPCVHLHFDSDNLAASFFKRGDQIIVRPESGVTLSDITLPNGEVGWVLE